jgi:hypothetical protein
MSLYIGPRSARRHTLAHPPPLSFLVTLRPKKPFPSQPKRVHVDGYQLFNIGATVTSFAD